MGVSAALTYDRESSAGRSSGYGKQLRGRRPSARRQSTGSEIPGSSVRRRNGTGSSGQDAAGQFVVDVGSAMRRAQGKATGTAVEVRVCLIGCVIILTFIINYLAMTNALNHFTFITFFYKII